MHLIHHGYSNMFLVVDGSHAMLVDTSTTGAAPVVQQKLDDLGTRLDLIVLTHFHYDHVGSAEAIRQQTGARIAIHHKDADRLRQGGSLNLVPTGFLPRLMATQIKKITQAPIVPDIELGDEEDLTQYGGFGKSISTPGHTPGSVSVVLEDGTTMAGDALTKGVITHLPGQPMFVDDVAESRASIGRIAALASTLHVAHFGHGDIASSKLRRFATKHTH